MDFLQEVFGWMAAIVGAFLIVIAVSVLNAYVFNWLSEVGAPVWISALIGLFELSVFLAVATR